MKSDKQKVLEDNDIKERWREYFNQLPNEGSIGGLGMRDDTLLAEYTFYHRIRVV